MSKKPGPKIQSLAKLKLLAALEEQKQAKTQKASKPATKTGSRRGPFAQN